MLGAIVLGILALGGVFAEVLASPAPIASLGASGFAVLPGVVRAAAYAGRDRADVERLHGYRASQLVQLPCLGRLAATGNDSPAVGSILADELQPQAAVGAGDEHGSHDSSLSKLER